jgi:hypothetical protein
MTLDRRRLFGALSTKLAFFDDERLATLIGPTTSTGFWGAHQTIDVAARPVFVKRVPVAALEYEQPFATRNLYDLPLFYNYGVGSAGLGVWRELLAHIKTTNWVLAEDIATFPLMYHWRVVPLERDVAVDEAELAGYITRWNSSAALERFVRDRITARHELVMFLEHVPHEMGTWLAANQHAVNDVLGQLFDTIAFLRRHGIVHLDAHFGNVVTDGTSVRLTDFGLALDDAFDLSDDERVFLRNHAHYDYGEVVMSLGHALWFAYAALPDENRTALSSRLGVDAGDAHGLVAEAERCITDLGAAMPLDPAFVEAIIRYREISAYMDGFLSSMQSNPRKDTPYDDNVLRALLADAGVSGGIRSPLA